MENKNDKKPKEISKMEIGIHCCPIFQHFHIPIMAQCPLYVNASIRLS